MDEWCQDFERALNGMHVSARNSKENFPCHSNSGFSYVYLLMCIELVRTKRLFAKKYQGALWWVRTCMLSYCKCVRMAESHIFVRWMDGQRERERGKRRISERSRESVDRNRMENVRWESKMRVTEHPESERMPFWRQNAVAIAVRNTHHTRFSQFDNIWCSDNTVLFCWSLQCVVHILSTVIV